ncbi:MAG TPA: ABC transporter permease [Candidatus Polarisedimenticolia bacterium]|nr:ABC transporter permease [Candidatus Polarisedimenticolia bacterium]
MSNFLQDLRYGVRLLLRSPGFAAAAVVTLALGIGANTALFSVVSGILLRPLPYPQPDRLMSLWMSDKGYPGRRPLGLADFNDWRSGTKAFEAAAAYTDNTFILTGSGEPEKVRGAAVTHEFFQALGVSPILGSGFAPGEDAPGAPRRVVLSRQLWERRFASSKSLVGQTIMVNGSPRLVAGVMPAGFEFPLQDAQSLRGTVQIWSLMINELPQGGRGPYYLWVVGRLKAGITPKQAAAESNQIGAQVAREHPLENGKVTYTAAPLKESMVSEVRRALLLLQGAVVFVLLIAAANVANLLLARSAAREREIAVRAALGAGRGRILRQLLTEGLLLAALGGAGGLLLARWGTDWLVRMSPESLPRLQEVGIDGRVLIFTGLTALACGILVSLAPGLRTLRSDLNTALKQGARTGEDRASQRTWSAFVVAEVALAAMLLVGAALMLTSFIKLQSTSPGFEPAKIRTVALELSGARYDTDPKINAFWDRMLEEVRGLQGVEAAGTGTSLPPHQLTVSDNFTIPGTELAAPPLAAWLAVSPDYFRALGVPILHGRDFTPADRQGTPWVTIINETLARRYFKDVDPIGQHIKIGGPERPKAPVLEIVGVAADVKFVGLDAEPFPADYEPAGQVAWGSTYLVVRARGDEQALATALRATFKSLDPDMPIPVIRTMQENISDSVASPRFRTLLLSILGGTGLLLAVIGVYGVISYSVVRRTREIGVRMALGAGPRNILRSVVGRGLLLTGAGLLLGMGGALALSRLLSGLLFGVTATDPRIYVLACVFFLAIALLACYFPARRAARVDPLVSLRCD